MVRQSVPEMSHPVCPSAGAECGAAERPPQADGDQRVGAGPARRVGFTETDCDGGSGARQGETPQCRG